MSDRAKDLPIGASASFTKTVGEVDDIDQQGEEVAVATHLMKVVA
jgi:hypothetical protein